MAACRRREEKFCVAIPVHRTLFNLEIGVLLLNTLIVNILTLQDIMHM